MLLDNLALISGIVLKAFSLYFLIMCLFFRKRSSAFTELPAGTRFACLVAARNEETVIANLIRSLKEQNYPSDLVDIYVIPNNCTDDTEGAALRAGAKIIRCKGPVKSKGDALREAINRLLSDKSIDAFLIFDADNIADRNFLKAMNDAFSGGAQVTKSRIESKNPYDSWVSGCYGLYYNIFNLFFNESRSRLKLSPKLIGTGLGIKREVLLEMGGWNTLTIAEDTEFNADCVIQGSRICWVPKAITYDETPCSFSVSLKQRRRWIGGIMAVARERFTDLFYDLPKSSNPLQNFDMAMILIMPYLQVLSVIPTLLILISGIGGRSFGMECLILLGGLAVSYVGIAAFALLLTALSPYSIRQMCKSILLFPVFTLSWMPLCFVALFGGGGQWEQIKHTRSMGLGELTYMRSMAS